MQVGAPGLGILFKHFSANPLFGKNIVVPASGSTSVCSTIDSFNTEPRSFSKEIEITTGDQVLGRIRITYTVFSIRAYLSWGWNYLKFGDIQLGSVSQPGGVDVPNRGRNALHWSWTIHKQDSREVLVISPDNGDLAGYPDGGQLPEQRISVQVSCNEILPTGLYIDTFTLKGTDKVLGGDANGSPQVLYMKYNVVPKSR